MKEKEIDIIKAVKKEDLKIEEEMIEVEDINRDLNQDLIQDHNQKEIIDQDQDQEAHQKNLDIRPKVNLEGNQE